MHFEQV